MTQSAVVKTRDKNKNDSNDNSRQKSAWGMREGWWWGGGGGGRWEVGSEEMHSGYGEKQQRAFMRAD